MAEQEIRIAEVAGSLCLCTDLGMGLPFGHGLGAAGVAMRLADKLGADHETAVQAYYGCDVSRPDESLSWAP